MKTALMIAAAVALTAAAAHARPMRYAAPDTPIPYDQLDAYMHGSAAQRAEILADFTIGKSKIGFCDGMAVDSCNGLVICKCRQRSQQDRRARQGARQQAGRGEGFQVNIPLVALRRLSGCAGPARDLHRRAERVAGGAVNEAIIGAGIDQGPWPCQVKN